jgi:hypothetical protein
VIQNFVSIRTFASTVEHVPLFAPLTRFLKHNIQSAFNDKQRGYLRQVGFFCQGWLFVVKVDI